MYPLAVEFYSKVIRSLVPAAKVSLPVPDKLLVETKEKRFAIPLSEPPMQDLQTALVSKQPEGYTNGLKKDAKFDLYKVLNDQQLLPPDFKLSNFFLIDADRDWRSNISLDAHFSPEMAKGLYDNLKRLERSLEKTVNPDISLPELERELKVIRELAGFYEQHKHLNSWDTRAESLSYLKAAAVCWILDLERRRDAEVVPRAKLGYVAKMFEVATPFEAVPAKWVKLPPAIDDYVAREKAAANSSQRELRQHVDVESLLQAFEPRLRDRWVGAWQALESDNPDAVSQAVNSMVEVLDKVIAGVIGTQTFEEYLNSRFPTQADMLKTQRQWIGKVKEGLHTVKHHTTPQSVQTAEDLMQAAELIIKMLLRK